GGIPAHVHAGDPHATGCWHQRRREDGDGGRLAGAVGAEEGEELASADAEADAIDGVVRRSPVPFDEALYLNHIRRVTHSRGPEQTPACSARRRLAPAAPSTRLPRRGRRTA